MLLILGLTEFGLIRGFEWIGLFEDDNTAIRDDWF